MRALQADDPWLDCAEYDAVSDVCDEKFGVACHVTYDLGVRVICHFERDRRRSSKGDGAKVLALILEVADRRGDTIGLSTFRERLVAYYRSFGFEVVRSGRDWWYMERAPR